jgi:DNA-binding transcriptional MerR regulator
MSQTGFRFPEPPRDIDINRLTLQQLCGAAQVTPRRVRYLISIGVLPPPKGKTKGARYSYGHLQRLRALKQATQRKQITARDAAEAQSLGYRKANGRMHVPLSSAPKGWAWNERVFKVTDNIRITASSELSALEETILKRVVRSARTSEKESMALMREAVDVQFGPKSQTARKSKKKSTTTK